MAFVKFSAFQFASDEFNSELARLVEGFTQDLLKIISEECVRNGDGDENSENGSKNSSPFSSPKGKAPRKKSTAGPKRGRPSKDDTDVVIETVTDLRSVSDELLDRIEVVRNSSASPTDTGSIPVLLDELLTQQNQTVASPEKVVEEQPDKKGKAKAVKEPKEKKEKPVKEPKEKKEKPVKEPKEKKEKPVKEPKEKKEKPVKEKKEKPVKETKAKKGKKGDTTSVTDAEIVQQSTETNEVVSHDDDDNDGLDAEIINSQSVTVNSFDSADELVASLHDAVAELSEEYDYAPVISNVDTMIGILEEVVSSSQNSQVDEIVIDQTESQDDDMSQPPPDDEDAEDQEEQEDEEGDGDEL
jgi:hypothetical protein